MDNFLKYTKKILKLVIKPIIYIISWFILLKFDIILKSNVNHFPVKLASLCFNGSLVYIVNPKLIKYHILDPDVISEKYFVWAGDWDKELIEIDKHEKYEMMKEIAIENKNYRDTKFYLKAINNLKSQTPLTRNNILLDSEEDIFEYFEKSKKLYFDIKETGFKLDLAPEIGITIDRNGNIIHFRQGHHTLAIANFLKEKKVKVRIRAVHKQWLLNQINCNEFLIIGAIKNSFKKLFEVE